MALDQTLTLDQTKGRRLWRAPTAI